MKIEIKDIVIICLLLACFIIIFILKNEIKDLKTNVLDTNIQFRDSLMSVIREDYKNKKDSVYFYETKIKYFERDSKEYETFLKKTWGSSLYQDYYVGSQNELWMLILKGTSIGNNSVVAAGSIVKGSYPDNVLISGNPAEISKKIICT